VVEKFGSPHWTHFELLRLSARYFQESFQRFRAPGQERADEGPLLRLERASLFPARPGGSFVKTSSQGSKVSYEANARQTCFEVAIERG
jgi:hypothetical protein